MKPVEGAAYYDCQAQARGIATVADVQDLARRQAPVYRRILRRWLPASRDAAIYEAACGPGILLHFLRDEGYRNLSGSDSSGPVIALARQAQLPVALADSIEDLRRYPAATWDCIVAIDFVEHLPKDRLLEFFAETARTVKSGGVLILRAPNADSPLVTRNLFNDITHYWAYTTVATRALLSAAGFGRTECVDESLAAVTRLRWVALPVMMLSRALIRALLWAATRENVRHLGASVFVAAWR